MTVDQEILTELAKVREGMTDLASRIDEHEQTRSYTGTDSAGTDFMLTYFCDGEVQLLTRAAGATFWGPAIRLEEARA